MRYGCNDIKYYLDHGGQEPESRQEFLNHIENCPPCKRMINLEPELEEMLVCSFTRKSLPESLEDNILARILKYEREISKENRMEKLLLPMAGLFSAFPIFLAVWFWKDIRSLFNSLDLTGTYNSLQSFISGIPIPEIDLAGMVATISNSPLIFLSLITITALVWAFSIIETQKALR